MHKSNFYGFFSFLKLLFFSGSRVYFNSSVRSWCGWSTDRSHLVDQMSYFSFQPVFHDWFNKGCGMCYSVCVMVHIKYSLLLTKNSSLCGGSRFPLSLSEWSSTQCLTPYMYSHNYNVLSVSLNKTFPSFLHGL